MNTVEQLLKSSFYSYYQYRDLITVLLKQNKTTGNNHSEAMINYTKMNQTRMNRIDKHGNYPEGLLSDLPFIEGQIWYVITEAWCGDAAQNIPWLMKIANHLNIEVRFILRDENLEIMDQFLTNGGLSIPKLIAINDITEIYFTWGPRPQEIQNQYKSWIEDKGREHASKDLHQWYTKNKGMDVYNEIKELLLK
jgi:hypothetical protein